MNYRDKVIQTARYYNGKERICGSLDCNLMILQIYEPYYYELLKNTYTTPKQGVKKAKELTGYRSVKEFIQESDNYVYIQPKNSTFGDIGLTDSHCTFIHLGSHFLMIEKIDNKEIFKPSRINHQPDFKYYRRI